MFRLSDRTGFRFLACGLAAVLSTLLSGCISKPIAFLPTTHPIRDDTHVTNLGPTSATATSVNFIGIPLSTPSPAAAALREAIALKNADALIGVVVDSLVFALPADFLPLINVVSVHVYGEAVKISE